MVDVAQLVELRIVTPAVEGSIPFVHPISPFSRLQDRFSGLRGNLVARVAKLVDAPDLGSGSERSEGASPFSRTIAILGKADV